MQVKISQNKVFKLNQRKKERKASASKNHGPMSNGLVYELLESQNEKENNEEMYFNITRISPK